MTDLIPYVLTGIAVFAGSVLGIEYSLWRGERKIRKLLRPYSINDVLQIVKKLKEAL